VNPDGFLADVLAEPATLAALLDVHDGPASPLAALGPAPLASRRVLFIGMGSSRFAALTVAARLRHGGVAAVCEYASTGAPSLPSSDQLAVGISASGTTPETVEALARHRAAGAPTLALTNRPESPLAAQADLVLPLLAGEEAGGVACRTFQATVAVLHLLAGEPVAALRPAVAAQQSLLDSRDEWLPALVDVVTRAHTTYAIAPAERIGSALQAALMLREGPRVAADAAETGDWLHVDVYLSKHAGYTALLFGGSRFDAGVMDWALERGSTIVALGRPVEGATLHVPFPDAGDPLVAALVEVSIAELVAATLWRRRLDAGLMP
jgi:glucosamine--fructose-6-phosphate aminotransferase (isomerizing)